MIVGMTASQSTFIVTYQYVPEMADRRAPHRPDHLAWLQGLAAAGRLLFAGATLNPVDTGYLVFRGEDTYDVRRLLLDDPYAKADLIVGVTVRPMGVAIGG
jgi:uncharacterized protein YciI